MGQVCGVCSFNEGVGYDDCDFLLFPDSSGFSEVVWLEALSLDSCTCALAQTRKPKNSLMAKVMITSSLHTKIPFSWPQQERGVS
jgi:hypothetical protein